MIYTSLMDSRHSIGLQEATAKCYNCLLRQGLILMPRTNLGAFLLI